MKQMFGYRNKNFIFTFFLQNYNYEYASLSDTSSIPDSDSSDIIHFDYIDDDDDERSIDDVDTLNDEVFLTKKYNICYQDGDIPPHLLFSFDLNSKVEKKTLNELVCSPQSCRNKEQF